MFLGNAFIDLGTWNCFTPFVGAGIGGAYNSISNFTDITPNVAAFGADGSSYGLGAGTNTWSFAWALYAGVSYKITNNFNVDLTYRYLNFGQANESVICPSGMGCVDFKFRDLYSHDLMLGLRWTCCEAPAPVVYQPPLRSRG